MAEMKDIAGFEGRYAVSDDGRVWSYVSNKWLSAPLNDWGYPKVCLHGSDKPRTVTVHRLVAETFLKKPQDCNEVNHIDGDKTNNSLPNLEWVTGSQNAQHAWDTGLQSNNKGIFAAQKARRKFSDQAVIAIRQMAQLGWTRRVIAELYQCNQGSIDKIINLKSYKEVSL